MSEIPSTVGGEKEDRKILVIDDEAGIRKGCERVLRSEGYQVFLAERGQEGLDILGREPDLDLVLVDLRMPGMSGLDFLLRAREMAAETVFAVITAYATIEAAVEATKRGAYDFIAKPFTPDELLRLVRRAMERVHLIRERNRLDAERRQRLLELTTEKGRLRKVIDCMADGVLVCNADQVLVLYNPAALKILSTDRTVQTPLPLQEVLRSQELMQMIADTAEKRKRISNEVNLNAGETGIWIVATIAPVEDTASGQFLGTVTVLQDITELKRVEQVKAQFVNMVAHELRTPIAAVDGFLSVMEKGYVQDEQKHQEIVTRARQRLGALGQLVDDLLDMSRMEAGTIRREILPQRIDLLLTEVSELMLALAEQNGIHIYRDVPEHLPLVPADREELIRLFNNLLSNAIKYNRPGGNVHLSAAQEGPYVKVSVLCMDR